MTSRSDIPSNTVAVINLGALRHNVRLLTRRAAGVTLTGVVKADAYGHGAVRTARVLVEEGVPRLAVATVAEGIELRESGIDHPILVFAPPLEDAAALYAEHDLAAVVDSPDTATKLESCGATVACHVEIDTGMARIGIAPTEAGSLIRRIETSPNLRLAGVMTHLANAETPHSEATTQQLDRLEHMLRELGRFDAPLHVANSAALFMDEVAAGRLAAMGVSEARAGIGLYGLLDLSEEHPQTESIDALQPVMELSTRVLAIRTIERGATVSYGGTWAAPAGPRRIATLGAGYADGYPRLCSNRAVVGLPSTGGCAPVAGRVCMDMTMIDLGPPGGEFAAVDVGHRAVLFGAGTPSCSDVARWAETITYEITCGVSRRVPRRFVDSAAPADGHSTGGERASPM